MPQNILNLSLVFAVVIIVLIGVASFLISEDVFHAKHQISDYIDDTTFILAVIEHLFELIGLPLVIFVLFYFPPHLAIHTNLRQILQSIGLATLVGTVTKWLTSLHSVMDYELFPPKLNNTFWAMHDTCRAYYYTVPPLMGLERTFATYTNDYEIQSNTSLLGFAILLTWSFSFGVLCIFYFAEPIIFPIFAAYIFCNVFFAAYFIYLYFINRRHYLRQVFQAHSLSDRYQHAENIRLIKPILMIQLLIIVYLSYSSVWMILYNYVADTSEVGRNYWGRYWHLGYAVLALVLPLPFAKINPNLANAAKRVILVCVCFRGHRHRVDDSSSHHGHRDLRLTSIKSVTGQELVVVQNVETDVYFRQLQTSWA